MQPIRKLEGLVEIGAAKKQRTEASTIFPIVMLHSDILNYLLSFLKPDYQLGVYVINSRERQLQWINISKCPIDKFPRRFIMILLKTHGYLLEHFEISNPKLRNWRPLLSSLSPETLKVLIVPRETHTPNVPFHDQLEWARAKIHKQKTKFLTRILPFTNLTSLSIRKNVSDIGQTPISLLARFTDLRDLDISNLMITSGSYAHLSRLSNLTSLIADNCITYPEEYEHLLQFPKLKKLSLEHTIGPAYEFNRSPIATIAKINTLTELNLSDYPSLSENFIPLFQLTNLRVLKMEHNNLTQEEQNHFSSLPHLKFTCSPPPLFHNPMGVLAMYVIVLTDE